MKNYYEILGLPRESNTSEINDKLRERKRLWVQRQNAPRPEQRQEAEANLRLVPEMEATLLDPTKRKAYDAQLKTTAHTLPSAGERASFDESEDLVARGWRLMRDGNVPDALYAAVLACERRPSDSSAWALRGYCQNAWGDRDDAIGSYRQALSLKPNEADLYFELASIYEDAELWDEAEKQYLRAKQIKPGETLYAACIGQIQFKRGNTEEGIRLLEACIEKDPQNRSYRGLLALAYLDMGMKGWTFVESIGYVTTKHEELETAEKYADKAEKLAGEDPEIKQSIAEFREQLAAARKRRFHGNPIAPAIWALMGLTMFGQGSQGIPSALITLVMAGLYVVSCMTPQYRLNKRVLAGKTDTSTSAMFDNSEGCLGMVVLFIAVLFLMPIMTLVNFVKNYLIK